MYLLSPENDLANAFLNRKKWEPFINKGENHSVGVMT